MGWVDNGGSAAPILAIVFISVMVITIIVCASMTYRFALSKHKHLLVKLQAKLDE